MTVFEYLQDNLNSTAGDIARAMGRKTAPVASAISQLYSTGRIVKSGAIKGVPTYRVNNLPFGCSNPLTLMFNRLLREVRRGDAQ